LGNTVNGKPLVFLEGQSNQVIDGVFQVILVNCANMVVQNVEDIGFRDMGFSQSIQLIGTSNTVVTNCKTHISLINSNNNTVKGNRLSNAFITLTNSNDNIIADNELYDVRYSAVRLYSSSHNMITQNSITGEYGGGIIIYGEYNRVCRNNISYRIVVMMLVQAYLLVVVVIMCMKIM